MSTALVIYVVTSMFNNLHVQISTGRLGTFHASTSTPIPDEKRIIQLVCSLLSIRYSRMIICTTTFVTIYVERQLQRYLSSIYKSIPIYHEMLRAD